MALIFSLLRAANARGTHHQLALDALDGLVAPAAWKRLFYKHISAYLDGAKAPDTAFKDFKNHVLHPRDGFWGGAPAQAETWYGELVAALTRQDWQAAAYAAGVLGHYCTDPCMPLHTHQTAAETNIHAGLEWSVSTSYTQLSALGEHLPDLPQPVAHTGSGWLGDLLRNAATEATTHYETLLAHYDIKRGVVAPEEGLDLVGQRAAASMLHYARRLLTTVLDRAIIEAAVAPDSVSLAGDALKAFVSIPMARRRKRKDFADDRRLIEAMYDELMATGRVDKSLREDDRRIQELFQAEVLNKRDAPTSVTVPTIVSEGDDPNVDPVEIGDAQIVRGTRVATETPRPAPRQIEAPEPRSYAEAHRIVPDVLQSVTAAEFVPIAMDQAEIAPVDAQARPAPSAALPMAVVSALPVAVPANEPQAPSPSLSRYRPAERTSPAARLHLDSDIVDAPSIGPKTAARLNAVGIDTVGDFLKAHPIALASRLEAGHLTPAVLTGWQEQARMLIDMPMMRSSHAQLLVGAGYRTVEAIAKAEPSLLCADVLHYALSPEGQRLIREGRAPDMEQLLDLAQQAREVKAA